MTKTISLDSDMSPAFAEAVRCRAKGDGFVSYSLILRLSPEEWGWIRMMGSYEAWAIVNKMDGSALVPSRTKTPTMDAAVLEGLLRL